MPCEFADWDEYGAHDNAISRSVVTRNQQDELNVNLEEYKKISSEILKRVELQQTLLNYQILLVGIIITAGLNLLNSESSNAVSLIRYFLLLSPLPFYFLSWSFSNHDIMIVSLARYINLDLRPIIIKLSGGKDLLRFEDFLCDERKRRSEKFGLLPTLGEEYLLPLIFPIVLLGLYIAVSYEVLIGIARNDFAVYTPQVALLLLNLITLVLTIRLREKTGKNYNMIRRRDS